MSEENVEIVSRVFAEWANGNFSSSEALDPYIHVVWAEPIFAQRAETIGIRETARTMQEFLDSYEGAKATVERIVDAGDSVAVVAKWEGRGKGSGIPIAERAGSVWTISQGKVTRIVNYRDPADAFEAAGLSE